VELAVLADRGGRELPVAARFTGGVVDVPADATLVLTQRDDATLTFTTEARTD
jgi:pyrimidine operon attenuation protein/uracil phosphoribosyltransferase